MFKPLGKSSIAQPIAEQPVNLSIAEPVGNPEPMMVDSIVDTVPVGVQVPPVIGELAPLPVQQQGRAAVATSLGAGKFWIRGVLVEKTQEGDIHITSVASKPGDATSSGAFTDTLLSGTGEQVLVVIARMTVPEPTEEVATVLPEVLMPMELAALPDSVEVV